MKSACSRYHTAILIEPHSKVKKDWLPHGHSRIDLRLTHIDAAVAGAAAMAAAVRTQGGCRMMAVRRTAVAAVGRHTAARGKHGIDSDMTMDPAGGLWMQDAAQVIVERCLATPKTLASSSKHLRSNNGLKGASAPARMADMLAVTDAAAAVAGAPAAAAGKAGSVPTAAAAAAGAAAAAVAAVSKR